MQKKRFTFHGSRSIALKFSDAEAIVRILRQASARAAMSDADRKELQSLARSMRKWHRWWWWQVMRNYSEAMEVRAAIETWADRVEALVPPREQD